MPATALPQPLQPLDSERASLEIVGGKGVNLARLLRNGLPVPDGFFIPVSAYSAFVDATGLDDVIAATLAGLAADDPAALEAASQAIRARFEQTPLPPALTDALKLSWEQLGSPPVAVRSSATAEDLPGLSFAGQQDTFLNVMGREALEEAVLACWSSLWTARAIGYRLRNGIPHMQVGMAVIVQEMADARASGVMFTANPVTGLRGEVIIEATLGLGEALVSGQVTPDRYIVSPDGALSSKTLGEKATVSRPLARGGIVMERLSDAAQIQALPDDVILHLAEMGRRIEKLFGFPQDIEWAHTHAGELVLLQSRPITSLYPLPRPLPADPLGVMIGLHVVQGVMEPLTPLGRDVLIHMLLGIGRIVGWRPDFESQTLVIPAGERLWINITGILRYPRTRTKYAEVFQSIDPVAAQRVTELLDDPRLAPVPKRFSLKTILHLIGFMIPFVGRTLFALCRPERAQKGMHRYFEQQIARTRAQTQQDDDLWRTYARRLTLLDELDTIFPDIIFPRGLPPIVASMAAFFGILRRLSQEAGQPQAYLEIARGMPHNVTTEMDLALWRTAQSLRADPEILQLFTQTDAVELARRYLANDLPRAAGQALDAFMQRYGSRGLGEIDIGRPRWREQPQHVIQTLQSYLTITDPEQAPDVVFARGADAADAAVVQLAAAIRSQKRGWIKARLVRWAARRYRALGGMREAPKFLVVRIFDIVRQALLASADEFVRAGLLSHPDDILFLTIDELHEIAREQDISAAMRAAIAQRRTLRVVEMRRTRIPRILLNDGCAFYDGLHIPQEGDENGLRGSPVSPGVVEGPARVVFDPHTTRLQPGEILVCPGTDPAWTPLFLAAGGLVMEVGGMMTHGAVVAREYGIPAVVGVHQATTRLKTGQRLRVDGGSGVIEILSEQAN